MPNDRRRALVAPAAAGVALLIVYFMTLAPDVTLWDAGEFNAAIATLGIPHPPGTPLYVLVARVWSLLLVGVPQAVAVNALSALATTTACALLARLTARWSGRPLVGIAAGVAAGVTYSLWQNATETEVYALSLLIAVGMLYAGDAAGRSGSMRQRMLLAYLVALAVPIQISALAAAPAAIFLAATPSGRPTRQEHAVLLSLGAAFLIATGAGVVSLPLIGGGLLLIAAIGAWRFGRRRFDRWEPALLVGVTVLGLTAALFMLLRAAHDPGINQGNPATWPAFVDVIARRQYDVPPLWPRRAPVWLQIGNLFQYADWQVALGLDDNVAASWRRTPVSIVYAFLAVYGARWHWRRDRRSAAAMLLLFASATLGVIAVLNLRAGPSIGAGVLAPDAPHEPRERDYFFALGFATAATWVGIGAVALAERLSRRAAVAGVLVAALPAALNWRATNRRREPEASLPAALGMSLVQSAPARSVLLLAGDNDSYATWFVQRVRHLRPDITPVTIPLLGADWYRQELARRDRLLEGAALGQWMGEPETLRRIRKAAERDGRPFATSIALERERRTALAPRWTLSGMVFVESPAEPGVSFDSGDKIDEARTDQIARVIGNRVPKLDTEPSEPASAYIARLLRCPRSIMRAVRTGTESRDSLLDSRCNFK